MRSETQASLPTITLACLPRKGRVRLCPSGCLHLTYGCVTLDFPHRSRFDALAGELAGRGGVNEAGYIRHGHALLRLSAEELAELRGMVLHAAEELRQVDAVRRLFPEEPGESDRRRSDDGE